MEQEKQPSYYMVIPASVWNDEELNSNAKLLYGHISTLTIKTGECWASNEYFSQVLNIEDRSIRRLLDLLEERKHITRKLITEGNNSKRIICIVHPASSPEDINVLGAEDKNVRHNNTSNNKTSKTAAVRKKTIDPEYKQAAAVYELDSLFRWERLIKVWRTEEDSTFQRRAAKKHFWGLSGETQEEIVTFVEKLGPDAKLLQKCWIGPMLKDGLFTLEHIKKLVEDRRSLNRQKSSQGKFKEPGYFGAE